MSGRTIAERARRAKWEREHRNRWIQEGFKAARDQASAICAHLASHVDRRTGDQRRDGMAPSNMVRYLRSASHRVRSMSPPETIVAQLAAAAPEVAELPCDVWLPPATLIKAGCPVEMLATALAAPGRPRGFAGEGHAQRGAAEIIYAPRSVVEAEQT